MGMQQLSAGDTTATGYLALPERGTGAGVLVLHAWWGLTGVFKDVCDGLAAAGFVAFAPDLYGGQTATTVDEAERLMEQSDSESQRAIVVAAATYLRAHPAVTGPASGTIGFSMGASWALLLSTVKPDDVTAVVVFYGTYPVDLAASRAAYLGHFAEQDDYEPLESVHELEEQIRAAGREVTFYVYPATGHWFFEANQPDAYDAASATLAWERTITFLQQHLGGAPQPITPS